jgi:predicted DNA-binding transcriptional regulator AlpA
MAVATMTPPTGPRLLCVHEVARKYSVAARTIWRWETQGRIPRGLRLTQRTVRWREDEIDRHLRSLS